VERHNVPRNRATQLPASSVTTRTHPDTAPDSMLDLLKNYGDFRYLWLGTIFTQGGQWILNVALGWLMLVLTDSPFWVGLVGFFGGIPMLVIAVPAGVFIDRYDRRSILIGCQIGLAAIGVALA